MSHYRWLKIGLLLTITFTAGVGATGAQDFLSVKPGVTDCNKLKHIFELKWCTYPVTRIEAKTFEARLEFSRVQGRHLLKSMIVVFTVLPPVDSFLKDVSRFDIKPESETPEILRYSDKRSCTFLSVATVEAKRYVQSLSIGQGSSCPF